MWPGGGLTGKSIFWSVGRYRTERCRAITLRSNSMCENKHCWKLENHTVSHTTKLNLPERVSGGIPNLNHRAKFSTKPYKFHFIQESAQAHIITYQLQRQDRFTNSVLFLQKVCTKYAAKQNTNNQTKYLSHILLKTDGSTWQQHFWGIICVTESRKTRETEKEKVPD